MVYRHLGYIQQYRKSGDLEQQQRQEQDLKEHLLEESNMELHCRRLQHHLVEYAHHLRGVHQRKSHAPAVLLRLLLAFSLISYSLFLCPTTRLLFSDAYGVEAATSPEDQKKSSSPPCSSVANNTICCDRTALRTDVCVMRGDVRTAASSNSVFLLLPPNATDSQYRPVDERIRPYTRKWESSIMNTIDELHLRTLTPGSTDGGSTLTCDVRHNVPAIVFSTGGYTGNVYHEFNDGIIPLYITSQHFNRQVVFVMLEYHDWWMTKYGDVVSQLSDYAPIDFTNDQRTHCFKEVIVGLKIHDELTVDSTHMEVNKTIRDFRQLLDDAYRPRVRELIREEKEQAARKLHKQQPSLADKPKLVIVSRNGSRALQNEAELVSTAESVGFRVEVLHPRRDTELAKMYHAMNSCHVMVGVHGAAVTHFLFMRPGSVFIQVVPLGTDWAAETYYGEPAAKLGLRYVAYKILPRESSLYRQYSKNDAVLRDPDSVNAKGWQVTKKVYLEGQNVRLDLVRFRKQLERAYDYWASNRMHVYLGRQQLKQRER